MVSRLFSVLGEPSRLTLLQALQESPSTVNELVERCQMKQANVSKQLAILLNHQLVKREREGLAVRYQIVDPMILSMCNQVCQKMAQDAKATAALFESRL